MGRGFFGRGDMQKEFEEAAFRLEKGQVSGVVETASGLHLIQRLANLNLATTTCTDHKQVRVDGHGIQGFLAGMIDAGWASDGLRESRDRVRTGVLPSSCSAMETCRRERMRVRVRVRACACMCAE